MFCVFRAKVMYMETGEKIKNLRKDKGLTGEQLGTLIGCSRQVICRYERGARFPDLDTLASIAVALEVEAIALLPDWFLEAGCN